MTGPSLADIEQAENRLDGLAVRTPLLESPLLNAHLGGRLLVKAECLQRTGSFKFRGAYNCVSQRAKAGAKGVVAYSSGNHAQGVADAAALTGLAAVIIMPSDAPKMKIAKTRALGAEVILYDRHSENREAIGARIVEERGYALVKPYDDACTMAGQGTVGMEIAEQATERQLGLDAVLCPCGGGGLIGGVALALEDRLPGVALHPVEPEGFDDWARSLAAGQRLANAPGGASLCDALMTPEPGEMTFAVNKGRLSRGLVVTDAEVKHAMREAFQSFKIVVEPGGAVALAACLSGLFDLTGKTVVAVCSGGNVDADVFSEILTEAERRRKEEA